VRRPEGLSTARFGNYSKQWRGNYILDSLRLNYEPALSQGAGVIALAPSAGNFGPTNKYKLGVGWPPIGRKIARSVLNICTLGNEYNSIKSSPLTFDAKCKPNTFPDRYSFATYLILVTPNSEKVLTNSFEYIYASGSERWYSTKRSISEALGAISSLSRSLCSEVSRRHAVMRSISAVRSRASAASFVACAAILFASATFSSDLRLSSFWRNPAICPNLISAATPTATRLSAIAEPHCSQNESYGGWIAAMRTVATTPTNTNPPPTHSQFSQDSIDFSTSSSLALIMPFGRRHAGKGFRGFWYGIAAGGLV
jgi:hypothetical protein